MRKWFAVFGLGFALAATAFPAFAENRVALVIGENAYEHVQPLLKAVGDAKGYAAALCEKGYVVTEGYDVKTFELNAKVAASIDAIQPGDMAVFVYSGHGWSDACGAGVRRNCDSVTVEYGLRATFRTAQPHIFAAGDVIGFPSLASTSMEQGRIAACHAFGEPAQAPPGFFPYGIYSVPEISTVGMTEEEVREKGIHYEVGIGRFRETSRGHIMGIEGGMMKLIFDLESRKLLGAHIIGEGATELVHIGQAVLNLGGTVDYFVENAFNYPTLAEAYKIAALDAYNRMPR